MDESKTKICVEEYNAMSRMQRPGYTPDLEASSAWQKPLAEALGFSADSFEQNADWYGGANDWQDAQKRLVGHDKEARFYSLKTQNADYVLFFLSKTGAVQDDYTDDAMDDPHVDIYVAIRRDAATGSMSIDEIKAPQSLGLQCGSDIEDLSRIGEYIAQTYPLQDPNLAARRYLYGH